jgi:hypothetical protein
MKWIKFAFHISPTPVNDHAFIHFDMEGYEDLTLVIYDAQGNVVHQ